MIRHHARRGAEGALAFPEFIDSEKRTEEEIDNLLLLAPLDSKFQRALCINDSYLNLLVSTIHIFVLIFNVCRDDGTWEGH